jgi:GNAT superfamily N-acetyltransferase
MTVTIERWHDRPVDQLAELVAESRRQNFRALGRLVEEWHAGVNRFDRSGEALFAACADGRVVGVCGLNADPYAAAPRVGRVRHLYVAADWRRRGVGRRLVGQVVAAARGPFDRLRLRTGDPGAARFYETLGFRPCPAEESCTHVLGLAGPA